MAVITASHLTAGNNEVDASSYTTASITPLANQLVLVAIRTALNTNATPTLSGASMTWVQIANILSGSGTRRFTVFRGLSTSPTTDVLTIDFAGVTESACSWTVDQFANIDTSGSNGSAAIKQINTNSGSDGGSTASTGVSVTLGAFDNIINGTYGAANASTVQNINAGTGFTRLVNQSGTGSHLASEWRNDNSTTVNVTWASDTGLEYMILGAELVGTTTSTSSTSSSTSISISTSSTSISISTSSTSQSTSISTSISTSVSTSTSTTQSFTTSTSSTSSSISISTSSTSQSTSISTSSTSNSISTSTSTTTLIDKPIGRIQIYR